MLTVGGMPSSLASSSASLSLLISQVSITVRSEGEMKMADSETKQARNESPNTNQVWT